MRSPTIDAKRRVGGVLIVALAVIAGNQAAGSAKDQFSTSLMPPMTVGPPFGEHTNLVAAMDANGEVKLAWDWTTGEGHAVQTADIGPSGSEAGSVTTISSSKHLRSAPTLALTPSGLTAIAWFEERKSELPSGDSVLALDIRDRPPGSRWQPAQTIWRPTQGSIYTQPKVSLAADDKGDEAVAWVVERQGKSTEPLWTTMIASRAANGRFTKPITLTTSSISVRPAVAIDPDGEVTVLWCSPGKYEQILTATWRAGDPPSAPVVLDELNSSEPLAGQHNFGELEIQASAPGDELATWLKGPGAGRPEPVALRAAWREHGTQFSPPQTVTTPGVDVRESKIAFSAGGRALLAWSELTSEGSGPDLNYVTGTPGSTFSAGSPMLTAVGGNAELQAASLADGTILLLWRDGASLFADRWAAGESVPSATLIGHLGGEMVALAGGGNSPPILVWTGHSPEDSATEAVRFLVGGSLVGMAPPNFVPIVTLGESKRLARQRSVAIRIRCLEPCTVTATVEVLGLRTENAEEAEGEAYRPIGALVPLHRIITVEKTETLTVRATRQTLRAYCRSVHRHDLSAIEAHVSVRAIPTGITRHFVLGETPTGGSCQS